MYIENAYYHISSSNHSGVYKWEIMVQMGMGVHTDIKIK